MRFRLLGLILFLVLPAVMTAQMTLIYDNDLVSYNRGLELYEKQKYGAAKEQFERAVKVIGDQNSEVSANAHFYIASCALELFHKDAEFLLKEFIRNYSTSPRVNDAWFLLGNYNYRKKDWDEAIEYYDQLQLVDTEEPRKSEYLFKKGYSYFQEEMLDEAASQFFQMKDETSVYYAPGVYYFAHINYEQGNYATALKSFKSLEGHDQFGEVVPYYIVQIHHFQEEYGEVISYGKPFLENNDVKRKSEISRLVGEALYHRERYDEAIPYLEDFMQGRNAKEKNDYYVLGFAYFKNRQYDEAAEQLSKISYSEDLVGQNALYHMGEAYLQADKKSYARNAYRSASKMDYDPELKEDALFKYAQLSYELSYDPYDGAISAFKEYIAAYPNRERTKEAFDYLVNIYLTSKNYDAALASISEYKNPDIRLREAFQRIAFNKGVLYYQERNFDQAITYFEKSLTYPQNKVTASEAHYWKSESFYYLGSYSKAVKSYEAFIYSPGAVLTPYFNLANYNIGYCYFQQDKFIEAPSWFRRYTSVRSEKDKEKLCDANLRIGDCYFMLKQYEAAETFYADAVKSGASDPDYALYQLAITSGLVKKYDKKLEYLNKLTANYPKSNYLGAAYFEAGRTHINLGQDDQALTNLNKVVSDYPGSSYARRALVSIGQTHYNAQRDDEALTVFKSIVEKYPTYENSREALIGIRNIYIDRGKVEKYNEFIELLPFASFSEVSMDSTNYQGAENLYFDGNCKEAVDAFNRYLTRFDQPIFEINARFYRAECRRKMGQYKESAKDYAFVADQPKNRFTESALVQVARNSFEQGRHPEALAHYKRLSLLGEYKDNLLESEVGQMRCNYLLNNYQGAIANAIIALETDTTKITPSLRNEAHLIIAKSNLQLKNPGEADIYLQKVREEGSPSQASEAMYLQARKLFAADKLDETETLIFEMVEKHRSEAKWIAKALILLSDVYVTRGDLFQASATLKNIIDNYKPEDDVKNQAREKLKNIEDLQNQTGEEAEEEIEIYFNATDSLNQNK